MAPPYINTKYANMGVLQTEEKPLVFGVFCFYTRNKQQEVLEKNEIATIYLTFAGVSKRQMLDWCMHQTPACTKLLSLLADWLHPQARKWGRQLV
ncbi:hypothetical protein LOK74_01880 [Brevibacillus humidisoli]|uniref:hypothetical protein n=1 Tax=Brevibacillus humidisoli TaxID=2895522 RepID=UPI001E3A654B|nr:hypothetical protein [Brevibacillus humidisoli]UFJ41310.1 hypothetical protein LOK74_01880 [Brevibacillus humidisoli]